MLEIRQKSSTSAKAGVLSTLLASVALALSLEVATGCHAKQVIKLELGPPAAGAPAGVPTTTVGKGVPVETDGAASITSSICAQGDFDFTLANGFLLVQAPASEYEAWTPTTCELQLSNGSRLQVRIEAGTG